MNIFKRIQGFFKRRKSDTSNIVYIDVDSIKFDCEVFGDARMYGSATIFDEARVDVCKFDEFVQSENDHQSHNNYPIFNKAQVYGNARVYSRTSSNELFSDLHKSVRGFRPTFQVYEYWNSLDPDSKQKIWIDLTEELDFILGKERELELKSIAEVEAEIESLIKLGQKTEKLQYVS